MNTTNKRPSIDGRFSCDNGKFLARVYNIVKEKNGSLKSFFYL